MSHPLLRRKSFLIPMVIICSYVLISLAAGTGFIASDYATVDNSRAYLPPSASHLFGTDLFGRSVLSRTLHGTKLALAVGLFSTLIALFIGVTLGAIAGYRRGLVDELVVWLFTTLDSIPYILLLASFAFVLGQGMFNLLLALGLTSWTTLCKLVRSEVIRLQNEEYVLSAKAQGIPAARILLLTILPNTLHLILIQAGVLFVSAIKIEVILSYLGLGMEPGSPSWGLMIDDAKQEITRGIWWNMASATIFMFGLILSTNLLLEALRKHFDPRSRTKHTAQ